jgi:hypothetical protein
MGTALLGTPLLVLGGLLIYALVAVWPAVNAAVAQEPDQADISFFWITYNASPDTALILLVAISSAFGSYIHAATSFGDYVGNRKLYRSWTWWYLLRFWIGISIALIFYFAVRGGFLAADGSTEDLNPYGIAALAGMTGLFSKQASDKLNEVFSTLFRVEEGQGDDARADSIRGDVPPHITSLEPETVLADEPQSVTISGTGFVMDSAVRIERSGQPVEDRKATYVDSKTLEFELEDGDVAEAGTLTLSVVNPSAVSEAVTLEVTLPVEDGNGEESGEAEEGGD